MNRDVHHRITDTAFLFISVNAFLCCWLQRSQKGNSVSICLFLMVANLSLAVSLNLALWIDSIVFYVALSFVPVAWLLGLQCHSTV